MAQGKTASVIPLSRPTQAHGDEITSLALREPTGEDAWACGMPLRILADGEMKVSMPEAMSLLARLASVPLSTIKSLSMPDLMQCVGVLMSFFQPSQTEAAAPSSSIPSIEPSTSPGSGTPTPLPFSRSA